MSSTNISSLQIVKRQLMYKFSAYRSVFSSLIAVHLLAIFFSIGGISSHSSESSGVLMSMSNYSANLIIVFTFFWAFINGITITMKQYYSGEVIFVTNRLTSNLSNSLFLLTASILGGITAILAGYLLKVISLLTNNVDVVVNFGPAISVNNYAFGVIATILYVLLFSALGYFIGILVQIHKIFVILLPGSVFGLLFYFGLKEQYILTWMWAFYFEETDFYQFFLKGVMTLVTLFGMAMLINNRQEVS